jgi:hypothetical protein
MKIDTQIDKIIEHYLPAISNGQETIDSVLAIYPQYACELRPRLEAVLWIVNAKKNMEPRQGFVASSRKFLEQRFESVQPHGLIQRLLRRYSPQHWAFNITAPVLLVVLLALIINSLVLTAKLSIPGDPLYSTKLLTENIQLALTFNQAHKTDLYIDFSRERTTEFVELLLEGDYKELPSAATRMETEIIASLHSINHITTHDLAVEYPMTAKLRDTLSSEIVMLDILKKSSPSSAHPGIELAIQTAQSGLMALR